MADTIDNAVNPKPVKMPTEGYSLPVETFEDFVLAGESDQWPMSFVFDFGLSSDVEIQRLDQAVRICATRHPLLFCTLDADRKRWQFNPAAMPPVSPISDGNHDRMLKFDLKNETGLKIFADDAETARTGIAFVFHHGCVDGLGALQFVKDVGDAYAAPIRQAKDSPAEAIRYLHGFRKSGGGNRLAHFLRWPIDILGMIWAWELIWNRPKAIEPGGASCSENLIANFDSHLTIEQTSLTRRLAKSAGQSVNDRVMEAVFLAIEEWNAEFNPGNCGELIRLMIPMNLRRKAAKSAANMVAMVNFDRKVGRWKSAARFRDILRLEMFAVKRMRAGVMANRYLQLEKAVLGRWPMHQDGDRCLASCLVSNLGDLSVRWGNRPGDPIFFGTDAVESFRVTAPLRPNSNLFVCLFSYLNRLNFSLTYNSRILNESHVSFLLESAKRHLFTE